MKTVTYDLLRADQAWSIVSQHLQRRNELLTAGVRYLEKHPTDHALAGRLTVLQYHLRATVRLLVAQTEALRAARNHDQQVQRQWMVVHQLHYLLRQLDDQLLTIGRQSNDFRHWREHRTLTRRTLRIPSPGQYMN